TARVELPGLVPLGRALDKCQSELLALETCIFSAPTVDFSKPLSLEQQVRLNHHLRSQEYFLAHDDRISEQLAIAIGNVTGGIIQSLPTLADSTFTVPLVCILPNPNDVVDRIIGTLLTQELAESGLFSVVQERIYENICNAS